MLLDLPVEILVHIAGYALEQRPAAGIPHIRLHLGEHKPDYSSSKNLELLLVCRKFYSNLMQVAYNKTRFTLCSDNDRALALLRSLPTYKVQSIRKLAFEITPCRFNFGDFLFETPHLRLDELVLFCRYLWAEPSCSYADVVSLLHCLPNIKVIKFVLYAKQEQRNLKDYCNLVKAVIKADHRQRYEASNAPIEVAPWWDISLNAQNNVITFKSQKPPPILPKEDYMVLMKTKWATCMEVRSKVRGWKSDSWLNDEFSIR